LVRVLHQEELQQHEGKVIDNIFNKIYSTSIIKEKVAGIQKYGSSTQKAAVQVEKNNSTSVTRKINSSKRSNEIE
jgi:hypothetical protein